MDILIANSNSGTYREIILNNISKEIIKKVGECEVALCSTVDEIIEKSRKAVKDDVDRVWVFGGDGTLALVAGQLAGHRTALAPLPGGTMNVFCRDFDLSVNPLQAVNDVVNQESICIDVGEVNGETFLIMASIGIDAEAVRDVNLNVKKIFGGLAYVIAAFKKLIFYKPTKIEIEDETGNVRSGYLATIQNGRMYGYRVKIAPTALLNDGLFDIYLLRKSSRFAVICFTLKVLIGSHTKSSDVEFFQASELKCTSSEETALQVDGDYVSSLPATIKCVKSCLNLFSAPK